MPKWSNYREATQTRGALATADREARERRLLDLDRVSHQPRLRKYQCTRQVISGAPIGPQILGRTNPAGWVLRRCNNPLCCNPEHLYTSAGTASLEERLLGKIDKQQDGCWIWRGHAENGYGRIVALGRRHVVHRVAYELWIEPVPEGLQVQHLCDNRRCCNPAHLVATAAENVQYMIKCRLS